MGNIEGKLTPEENLEKIVFELKMGEEGYIDPIYLEFDYDLNGYLDMRATAKKEFDQDSCVYVKKIGNKEDDYFVDISRVKNYKWERTHYPFGEEIKEITSTEKNLMIAKLTYRQSKNYLEKLNEKYNKAIEEENYELAGKLKKQIDKFSKK